MRERTVLVTGANGGLGRALASRLAAEGCALVLTDVQPLDDMIADSDLSSSVIYAASCELESPASVAEFAEAVTTRASVNCIVNNAALQRPVSYENVDDALLSRYVRINVGAPLQLTKAVEPAMRAAQWGRVVNVFSASIYNPPKSFLPYVVSKAALVGLTNALAVELGTEGITVNAVSPALTRHAGNWSDFPEEVWNAALAPQAIKRPATPLDFVGTVSFLLSEDAGFMTGQKLAVDGGVNFK